jgi:hypothetical protein
MLQDIFFDLRISGIADDGSQIQFFQRELHLHRFSADLSLGKCNNTFDICIANRKELHYNKLTAPYLPRNQK